MRLRFYKWLVVVVILGLVLSACAAPSQQTQKPAEQPAKEQPTKEQPQEKTQSPATTEKYTPELIKIGAAAMGGNYFVAAGSLATILTKQAKLQTSVLVTGGGRNNAILANDGKIDIGFSNTVEISEEWTKNNRQNIRSLMPSFSGELHIVVMADSKINDIMDLSGATVSLGAAGSTHAVAGALIFDVLGIKPKKIVNANLEDSANLMRDKQIDAMMVFSAPPVSSISELATTHNIRLIGLSDEQINKIIEKIPAFSKKPIPANSYKGQTKEVQSISSWNIIVANKNLSDDLVYQIVTTAFKFRNDLIAAMKGWEGLDLKNVSAMFAPIHPGAIKYYKEQGVSIPDRMIPPEYK